MSEQGPITIGDPTWPDVIRALQSQVQARIHTALPATVVDYDTATQTATVQLVVQLEGLSVPPLAEVPVCWPGGAAGFLHVPLAAGDNVVVLFSESDFSKWWVSGSVSPPASLERHGFHAIAIPGLRRAAAPLDVTGGHVTLAGDLHLGADSATDFVALASLVSAQLSTLKSAISGAPVVAGDGGASFKAALLTALSAWPGSVASSQVKST